MSLIDDIQRIILLPNCPQDIREELEQAIAIYKPKTGLGDFNPFKLQFKSAPEAEVGGAFQLNLAAEENRDVEPLITWIKLNIHPGVRDHSLLKFEYNQNHAIAFRQKQLITVNVNGEARKFSVSAVDLFNTEFRSYKKFLNSVQAKFKGANKASRTSIVKAVTNFMKNPTFVSNFTMDEINGSH